MNGPKGEETIFAEALRLPPEERTVYLTQATHGNAELRQRVESLLGSYQAGSFLEKAAAPQLRQTLTVPLTEKPGDIIGRYKLLQQIGEGGCGIVYMAEQAEPVRRRVALKIIKLGMDTKSVIARFEAERQALAMMDHPNIAKVFDAGATETGRPYFVMELVRGMKITDYCDEKKLSTHERLDLFILVCGAIQHAHQKGIIHRDIKPSNILVTVNDGVAVPKVIDFGVAKATGGQQLTDKTLFTAFEQFIGTPAYMSPEQAVLTSLDIDTRSDIYALGVLLYELMTGQTPFDARELLAIGLDEMRRTIREKEPERPSTRVSTLPGQELSTTAHRRGLEAPKLVSELRGDLDWIVMKCLEKDRARRYETANGLATDLKRHLSNEPVVARPPSKWYEFQKTVRRHRFGFAATAAVIIALASGLAVAGWMFTKERAAVREQSRLRQQAQAGEQKAQSESAKSQQVAQFLQEMLRGVGPSVAAGRDTELLQEILDRTEERLGNELTNRPEVEAELRNVIGSVYVELGQFDQAEAMFTRSLVLLRQVFGDDSLAVADTLHNLADLGFKVGKNEEAESSARQALAIYEKLLGRQSGKVGNSLNALGFALDFQGKHAEAEAALREALEINRKAFDEDHPQVGLSLSRLGLVLMDQNKLDEAETVLREAVRIQKNAPSGVKQFGLVAPDVELGWTLSYLAGVLEKQWKLSEAETNLSKALAVMSKVLPKDHTDRLAMLEKLTAFFRRHGTAEQVMPLYEETVELRKAKLEGRKAKLGPDNPDTLKSMLDLANTYADAGKYDQALPLFVKTLELRKAKLGPNNPDTLNSMNALANTYRKAGKFDQALPLFEEVLKVRKANLGPEHYDTLGSVNDLALTYEAAGKLDRALPLFEESLKGLEVTLGPDYRDTLLAMNNLAHAYDKVGKLDQALPLFKESLKGLEATLGPDQRETLTVMDNLAWAYGLAGKLDQALPLCEKTLRLRKTALGPDHPDTLISMNDLALIYGKAGKPDQALTLFEETLKRMEVVLGPDHQETRNTMRNLANALAGKVKALLQAGKFAEAEPRAQECLRLREKLIPDSWLTFNAKSQLGGSLLGQQEYAEAEPLLLAGYKGMMARTDQIPPQGRTRVTETLQRLVRLYEDTNRPERATEWKQNLANLEPADSLREQANSLARQQKWKEAAAVLRQAVELNPDDHFPCYQLAILYVQSGQSDQYRELCRRSVERFGHATDPRILERIAKNCLILPDSGADLVVVAQMAHRAAAADPSPWRQFVKGLADYRQENFTGAVESMRKLTAPRQGFEGMGNAMAYMVLAMAHYQLNQMDEAGAAFTKGVEISRTLPSLESGGPWVGYGWINWIEGHTLMSEAEALIEGSGRTMAETK